MSCGSPMPRGERIAKPAEWETPMRPVFALRAGSAVDDWVAELRAGRPEPAWDRFLDRYRRRIFEHVFLDRRSHVEAYELIRSNGTSALDRKTTRLNSIPSQ